jgi:phosphoglycerate kinase
MGKIKTLDDFDFKGKRVILRADINSDVKNGKILMSERIKEASKTIQELIDKKAKVVVLAHQGNPGKEDFLSLKQHAVLLNQYVKIRFVDDIIGSVAIKAIKDVKEGEAILLDNIRRINEELEPNKYLDNKILKNLVPLFDIYVNDAFSNSHRAHTSMIGFPKEIKNSCMGRIMEKEVKALEKLQIRDCLYILGGAKPEEDIKLLRGKRVLACGLFAQMCLVSKGKNLGYQNEFLKKATLVKGNYNEFLGKLKEKQDNVETPIDFAVNYNGKRKEFLLESFPLNYEIEDIGENTIEKYIDRIKKAPAIYMKGPAGNTQDKQYATGTEAILKAISESKGFTLIGGGHLSDAIENMGIDKNRFGHISLSGGALLSYIAGEKLPGLEALR